MCMLCCMYIYIHTYIHTYIHRTCEESIFWTLEKQTQNLKIILYIVREERISFMVMQKWVFSKTRLLRAHAFSNHPQERVAGVEGWAGAQGGARRRKVQVLWWLVISGGSYYPIYTPYIIKIIHCGSFSDHPTMIHEWSWLFSSMICWFSWAIRIRDGNAYEQTIMWRCSNGFWALRR